MTNNTPVLQQIKIVTIPLSNDRYISLKFVEASNELWQCFITTEGLTDIIAILAKENK